MTAYAPLLEKVIGVESWGIWSIHQEFNFHIARFLREDLPRTMCWRYGLSGPLHAYRRQSHRRVQIVLFHRHQAAMFIYHPHLSRGPGTVSRESTNDICLDIVRWTRSSKTRTGPRLNITTRRPPPSTPIMATPTTNSLLSQRTSSSESEMCRYRQAKGVGLYQYIRALACFQPFPTARRNLIVQFQRNQADYKEYMERRKQKKGPTPRRQLLKVGLFNCVHGAATTVLYQ